jgi:hypothetical protein
VTAASFPLPAASLRLAERPRRGYSAIVLPPPVRIKSGNRPPAGLFSDVSGGVLPAG